MLVHTMGQDVGNPFRGCRGTQSPCRGAGCPRFLSSPAAAGGSKRVPELVTFHNRRNYHAHRLKLDWRKFIAENIRGD